MKSTGYYCVLLSVLVAKLRAGGGGGIAPPKALVDESEPKHKKLLDEFKNLNDSENLAYLDEAEETSLMEKMGSITDAHSPTYSQDNPFPRPFWPQNVKFSGKMWASVMFSLWSAILCTYVYIKASGRDYASLFPDGADSVKRASQDSRTDETLIKPGKRNIYEINEENESAIA